MSDELIERGMLEDWILVGGAVRGTLYGDPTGKIPNGHFVTTSKVLDIEEEHGVLWTTTGVYELGAREM